MMKLTGGDVPACRACPQLPSPERQQTNQCAAAAAQGVTLTRQTVVETPRVRLVVRARAAACVWCILVPAVAARLFADRVPGVGAAGTFDLRARHPRLTSLCPCR